MLKYLIACSAAALAASGVHAQAADNKAELFGQRASLQDVDISPDGQSIVYVAPGPGRQTVAYIAPLEGGTPQPILSSDANPPDRKSVVEGKGVSVRVDCGGCRIIKK